MHPRWDEVKFPHMKSRMVYPQCATCTREQIARLDALLTLCIEVMTPVQIASVREHWEAMCAEHAWPAYSSPLPQPATYHPPVESTD
jgi:hypothetical protein